MSKTDYDLRLIRGIAFDVDGVLSPACVNTDKNGIPQRMINMRDGYAISEAIKHGFKIAILSGSNDKSVVARYRSLGVPDSDVHLSDEPKLPILLDWMKKHDLSPVNVAYVGDDIPDYECMRAVGFPVAPADAAPELSSVVSYFTNSAGGHGVARELIEQILKANGFWPIQL